MTGGHPLLGKGMDSLFHIANCSCIPNVPDRAGLSAVSASDRARVVLFVQNLWCARTRDADWHRLAVCSVPRFPRSPKSITYRNTYAFLDMIAVCEGFFR